MLITINLVIAKEKPNYQAATYQQLPGWHQGDQSKTIKALKFSCEKILKTISTIHLSNNQLSWRKACQKIISLPKKVNNAQARKVLTQSFQPYQVSFKGENTGLFTGYYEPIFKGSPIKTSYYKIPIYKRPQDLVVRKSASGKHKYGRIIDGKFSRHYSRQAIADNNFFNSNDVIAWVHDRIDRTFLQIQGSGRIMFPDGSSVSLSYDGQNGWPYKPIGKALLEQGELPREVISMQTIKEWLKTNPKDADEILNYDPSFVFFKRNSKKNITGAEGTPLTPGYSMAVDWRYIDYGTPIWLNSYYPTDSGHQTLNRLLIAQDTGGAIRGPIRGDVFWGHTENAEYTAGHMKSEGQIWILLPNGYEI
ncbi:MltA domain-containing protein [Thiotrichales bacterium 19S11-10]|nr:MltA domain-containing protein [Thiotrichales bacterium 19S11-10]